MRGVSDIRYSYHSDKSEEDAEKTQLSWQCSLFFLAFSGGHCHNTRVVPA
jgi:hypothetical protein